MRKKRKPARRMLALALGSPDDGGHVSGYVSAGYGG